MKRSVREYSLINNGSLKNIMLVTFLFVTWVKRLEGDRLAVLLLNANADQTKSAIITWKELNIDGKR